MRSVCYVTYFKAVCLEAAYAILALHGSVHVCEYTSVQSNPDIAPPSLIAHEYL